MLKEEYSKLKEILSDKWAEIKSSFPTKNIYEPQDVSYLAKERMELEETNNHLRAVITIAKKFLPSSFASPEAEVLLKGPKHKHPRSRAPTSMRPPLVYKKTSR